MFCSHKIFELLACSSDSCIKCKMKIEIVENVWKKLMKFIVNNMKQGFLEVCFYKLYKKNFYIKHFNFLLLKLINQKI